MKTRPPTQPLSSTRRPAGTPRMNLRELATVAVAGEIVPPTQGKSPYRIGRDGVPRVLPGPGGIVLSHRLGDRCVGLAADHLEPGVAVQSRQRSLKGEPNAANLALNTYACVGNLALVLTGPCAGKKGVVTGKHGGVSHVLVDFSDTVLRHLRIGDKIQIYSHGLGLRLPEHPELTLYSCSPRLIRRWGLRSLPHRLVVPVTHQLPAGIMGSGLGRDNAARGDYDIQLFDPEVRRRYRLDRLRFGDLVAIRGADTRYGRAFHTGYTTIGIVVHSDSTKSGHGPGVVTLITGESRYLEPVHEPRANLAALLRIRDIPRLTFEAQEREMDDPAISDPVNDVQSLGRLPTTRLRRLVEEAWDEETQEERGPESLLDVGIQAAQAIKNMWGAQPPDVKQAITDHAKMELARLQALLSGWGLDPGNLLPHIQYLAGRLAGLHNLSPAQAARSATHQVIQQRKAVRAKAKAAARDRKAAQSRQRKARRKNRFEEWA